MRALNGDISKVVATLLRNTAAAVSLVARDGVPGGGAHEVLEVGCATHVVMIVLETVQQRRQVIEGADSSPGVDKDLWALLKFCVNVVFNLVAVVNDGGDGQVGAAGDGRRRELAVEADAARALSLVLGLLRDDGLAASVPLMQRALARFEGSLASRMATLCWVAGAALEAIEQTPLNLTPARKRLFALLDREIRGALLNAAEHRLNEGLLRELLFLVALADAGCDRCAEVSTAYQLPDPGFTEYELNDAFAKLHGPGIDVMRSVAEALREEVNALKDLLDLLARNAGDAEQSRYLRDAELR